MALTDPQKIKIGATETTLPRVSTGNKESVYESADGLITLKLSTVESRRNRQTVRVDLSKITPDPFIPTQNTEVSMSVYIVVDRPTVGYTNKEAKEAVEGLLTLSSASTYALIEKLLARES
ncbi:TPA_asm: coat protein [ssRNA phage Gerhypos.3_7]|uniref:Coat protein n=2 Tax=Leviviricetes TaxID=2842243 RepID=A0A8S5KXZ2_9VIRU|nr:coat protein [ssRNA phage Gerhypos.3_7]QDH86564.1 MAG: hypothetical protein H3Bulk41426_000002 [Leviviridae sp.]DAD50281.1 TPA_asm: coat protein [ssRNA phage Gerhypos.3_7]